MIKQLPGGLILHLRSLNYVVDLFEEVPVVHLRLLSHDVLVHRELSLDLCEVWENRVHRRYITHVD